jgi:hypothetical protein
VIPEHEGGLEQPRTVSEPAVANRPLTSQRATNVSCAFDLSDDVSALREAPIRSLHTLEASHWPMVSVPGDPVSPLAQVKSD